MMKKELDSKAEAPRTIIEIARLRQTLADCHLACADAIRALDAAGYLQESEAPRQPSADLDLTPQMIAWLNETEVGKSPYAGTITQKLWLKLRDSQHPEPLSSTQSKRTAEQFLHDVAGEDSFLNQDGYWVSLDGAIKAVEAALREGEE
jgi:hypothetical protein